MRIFVAGATGVIGIRLLPLLVEAGHVVAGMTRTPAKTEILASLGAESVVGDVYDVRALTDAVVAFAPDAVMHQVTDLPDDVRLIGQGAAANARIRREGTRNLLAAARAAGTTRFFAQSVAWEIPGEGGAAAAQLERMVLEAGGVVLRYGRFYGSGTYYETALPPPPRVAVDRAARRTLEALDAETGIVTIAHD
jgi:nucleoside-diphosphate-sugar epimerase